MTPLPKVINSDTVKPDASPWGKAAREGTFTARKVVIWWNGKNASPHDCYQLQGEGSNEATLDPLHNPQVWQTALELAPNITQLDHNVSTRKSLVPVQDWQVRWKLDKDGTRERRFVVGIRAVERLAPDLPTWASDLNALGDFVLECNSGDKFIDEALGLPRANWPDRDACLAKVREAIAAVGTPLKQLVAKQQQPADKEDLNVWFPRDKDGKPVDDPKTDELMGKLGDLVGQDTDARLDDDELTTPATKPAYNWTLFWVSVRNLIAGNDLIVDDHHEYVHKFFDIPQGGSLKDSNVSPDEMLRNLREHLEGVRRGTEKMLDISIPDYPPAKNNAPDAPILNETTASGPTIAGTVIQTAGEGTNLLEQSKSSSNSPKDETMQNDNPMNEAAFVVLFSLFNPIGVEMKYTVRAMTVDELDERVTDLVKKMMAKGYTAIRQAPAAPSNVTPISDAPSAQASNNGKSPCMLVKVGKSYEGNKPQLEFEVDGFDKPLRFTSENLGKLASMFNKVRKPDGSEFTASDMTDGRKFGGNWLVRWEKVEKNGKTYTNVVSLEPAA